MRIVCPSCSAAYEVPDRILAAGKKVRCARCGENWLPEEAAGLVPPEPPPPPPLTPVPLAPAPTARTPVAPPVMPAPAVPPPEPQLAERPEAVTEPAAIVPGARPPGGKASRGGLPVALGVSTLALAGMLAAAVVWRAALMAVWPPSQRLFGWLGLG
ncbi:MAG: zinc-ribbon domain-containing protein [Alphaproteobacteria bacterium]|nr:zinc-ribbon domain-containing protein [Alphaproteobacteria bacterium]